MAEERPFKPGVIQPGMERVIDAGDTLEITDDKGQVFAVTANESKETMAFLKAFDEWYMTTQAAKTTAISKTIVDALWQSCLTAYNNLPMRIHRELPSFKSLGVSVGHRH